MKTLILSLFLATSLFCSSKKATSNNDKSVVNYEKLVATFDNYNEGEYVFSYINEEDEEEIMIFNKATDDVLEKYNFTSDRSLIGEKFELTFETQASEDEDSEDDVIVIIDAKQL